MASTHSPCHWQCGSLSCMSLTLVNLGFKPWLKLGQLEACNSEANAFFPIASNISSLSTSHYCRWNPKKKLISPQMLITSRSHSVGLAHSWGKLRRWPQPVDWQREWLIHIHCSSSLSHLLDWKRKAEQIGKRSMESRRVMGIIPGRVRSRSWWPPGASGAKRSWASPDT